LPDSEVAVESERKNPFTITGFSIGKLLCRESVRRKGRIKPQVKAWFRTIPSYALDSEPPIMGPTYRHAMPIHVAKKLVDRG
jgi:hypothetical protein